MEEVPHPLVQRRMGRVDGSDGIRGQARGDGCTTGIMMALADS